MQYKNKYHFHCPSWPVVTNGSYVIKSCSGDGSDMNPALPDTSIKLGRYVHKHGLFEIFSLAYQN